MWFYDKSKIDIDLVSHLCAYGSYCSKYYNVQKKENYKSTILEVYVETILPILSDSIETKDSS